MDFFIGLLIGFGAYWLHGVIWLTQWSIAFGRWTKGVNAARKLRGLPRLGQHSKYEWLVEAASACGLFTIGATLMAWAPRARRQNFYLGVEGAMREDPHLTEEELMGYVQLVCAFEGVEFTE